MKQLFLFLAVVVIAAGCSSNTPTSSQNNSECPEHFGETVEDLCEGDYFEDRKKKKKKVAKPKAVK